MIFRGDKLTQKVYFTHFKDISSFTHGHSETEKKKKAQNSTSFAQASDHAPSQGN